MKNGLMFIAILGASGVLFGAMGRHTASALVNPETYEIFTIGLQYQWYHTLAMFGLYLLEQRHDHANFKLSFYSFFTGIVLFSGGAYLKVLGEMYDLAWAKSLGFINPIGGLALTLGWISLVLIAYRIMKKKETV